MGGALSKTLLCPLQRVVVLKQLGDKGSTVEIAQKIMREGDGAKAFWRGNLTSILIRFPYSGIQLIAYDQIKHVFQNSAGLSDNDKVQSASSFWGKFLSKGAAGAAAATISGTIVFPGEVIRTRLMSGNAEFRTITGTASAIWKETNGPRNFYRGLGASLTQRVPDILLNYAVYESVFFEMKNRGFDKSACIMSGSAAAALAAIAITFPLDVVKRRMQMAGKGYDSIAYRSMLHCITDTYSRNGLRAFYAGASLEAVRCVPQVGLMWFTIEFFRDLLTTVDDRYVAAAAARAMPATA